jgi:hypothetical protein
MLVAVRLENKVLNQITLLEMAVVLGQGMVVLDQIKLLLLIQVAVVAVLETKDQLVRQAEQEEQV